MGETGAAINPVCIGTSGWVYPHWRDLFYPRDVPQRLWLDYYAARFDTVEINNSFYRLPSPSAFQAWSRQAPPGFTFAVKASRFLTHMKKLKEPEGPLQLFFERAHALGPHLGPVLYQLPPRWKPDFPRLEYFLKSLPRRHAHAIEFREQDWLVPSVLRLLERFDVALCIHDLGELRIPPVATASFVYLRFHGDRGHNGQYGSGHLAPWAERIWAWQAEGLAVYAYFNNDVGGHAVVDAVRLRELVGKPRGRARPRETAGRP